MKKKEDDLAKLDGKYMPLWVKVIAFVISFLVAFFLFSWFMRL